MVPPYQVPQVAIRAFGNQHRLSPHALQLIMNGVCARIPCEAEIPPKPKEA